MCSTKKAAAKPNKKNCAKITLTFFVRYHMTELISVADVSFFLFWVAAVAVKNFSCHIRALWKFNQMTAFK